MSSLHPRLPVQIDQGPKAARFAAYDRGHQRKSKRARTNEGLWRPAHPHPDREGVLHRPRVDSLSGQSRPESAGPVDVLVLTDLEKQLELLRKELIVVLQPEPEQRKGLDGRPTANHHLRTTVGKKIDRRKFLEQPYRV